VALLVDEELSEQIIGAAIEVHRATGPGLLESAYQNFLEVKAVEKLIARHEAQLLTYLKLSGKRIGLMINFNSAVIRNSLIRRIL
jgi:hypothetical protein